ncbi:hypothetical protein DMZ48_01495 [Robertkochia solimangrovi]|nr:hypothetical protein DMZ48_01495 [Robertkochia solimangrovi]
MLCSVFGHRYRTSKKITPHITEYRCKVCNCETTTTVSGKLDVLTPELKEINQTLADFYRRRHSLQTVA